ncbi:DUF4139 domain-containing protein [Sphingomicrobium marinum]|uniref:DUF4139 domain-containing protein n=1 Tax=Sphingomicrobium marinum TaxID=1227950 RepID=UPI00223FDD6A|nr:hypothetical protein [Sphingomicrobium marinum]
MAGAQPVVVSPQAEDVSVAIYRNNDREPGEAMNANWLGGFALVTETRTITIPAGPADVRFEGVAGNIFPQSVILSGLPGLPDEKNYDARVLTPGALLGGALGQQVSIRRTNPVTGEATVEEAIIRAGPDDVVLQTVAGFEAYQCTGLNETIIYNEIPAGLSAKPALSIRTNLPAPVTARVQLSYLASQFDWDANYVVQLDPDGETMSLFAWMTVGNLNSESFEGAELLAVAGEPNREDERSPGVSAPSIRLNCFPKLAPPPPPPPPPPPGTQTCPDGSVILANEACVPAPPPPATMMESADIMVTGSRVAMQARQEDLADLKLYRVPERVTVAASGQKQIAFLTKSEVDVERVHRFRLNGLTWDEERSSASIVLRSQNLKKEGLGEPLPAGNVVIFEPAGGRLELVGEDGVDNIPVGQKLELEVGSSPDVAILQRPLSAVADEDGTRFGEVRYELVVTNAKPFEAQVEIQLGTYGTQSIRKASSRLVDRDGRKTIVVTMPPQSERRFTYTLREVL